MARSPVGGAVPGERLATGIADVDAMLAGGIETDSLTEVYGEGGSGKTLFCLQLATRVALADRWVFYIDTEGVSVDRIEAISGGHADQILRRVLLSSPKDLEEQNRAVRTACQLTRDGQRPVGLIVVDSATFYYRLTLSGDDEDAGRLALALELGDLVSTALACAVPVVFTNQVWRSMRNGTLEPLGGSFANHAAKTILRFDRLPGARRRVVLLKHRSLPERSADFEITDSGLR